MIDAEAAVNALASRGSALVALAESVSLAVRIEPQLLRAMRLSVVPSADAGDEADLWFSAIVEARTPSAITLDVDAARVLRQRLAASPAQLDAAWRVVEAVHREISPVLLAEEELAYLALAGEKERARTLLRSAVATLNAPDRRAIAPWATNAFARMPDEARAIEEALMLLYGASLVKSGAAPVDEQLSREQMEEWAWLAPSEIPREQFGVALLEHGVEIGPPGGPRSHRIEVPRTAPMVVNLAWIVGTDRHDARVALQPGVTKVVETDASVRVVEIRTILGEVAHLSAINTSGRPPRVRITYDVETGGAVEQRELPFVVGVLADLSGNSMPLPDLRDRKFIEINPDNFDAVFAAMKPALQTRVAAQVSGVPIAEYRTQLEFRSLDDFDPVPVAAQVKSFTNAVERQISGRRETILTPKLIDRTLSQAIDDVLHHPDFQRLEATWRGLKYLVGNTELSSRLKIKVLNVSKEDLANDFQATSNDVQRSALFRKVYEEEFGVFGASPFGMLVGDYYFDKSNEDVELLKGIASVAAVAHAPFIAAASPHMFDLDRFSELGQIPDLSKVFENPNSKDWNAFRGTEGSQYVGLCMPSISLRTRHAKTRIPLEGSDGFEYEEGGGTSDEPSSLWGNAAWSLAARINAAQATYGWCATMQGVDAGPIVHDPVWKPGAGSASGDKVQSSVEAAITTHGETQLGDLGFIPLEMSYGSTHFPSVGSVMKPATYSSDEATRAARASAELPYVFATSRFAHYLKTMVRDKIGGYMSADELSTYLNHWIASYVSADDRGSLAEEARRPLKEARIDITDPRARKAVAYLNPRFQLPSLSVSMRIVIDLPSPAM